jgi:hypothetical protein
VLQEGSLLVNALCMGLVTLVHFFSDIFIDLKARSVIIARKAGLTFFNTIIQLLVGLI